MAVSPPIPSSTGRTTTLRPRSRPEPYVGSDRLEHRRNTLVNAGDSINRLVPNRDNGYKLKARAIGATLALRKGVPVDDVAVQGNWSSSLIVNEFYRLPRVTAQNFTDAVLDSSGVTSIVSSQGRTMDSVVEQSDN
jgi:hypothetical protein